MLTGAIIGLLGVFSMSMLFPEEDLAISRVKFEDAGRRASVTGHVVDVRSLDDVTILTVACEESIDVFVRSQVNVSVGDGVRIQSEVDEYQGEKEIIADRIHFVNSQSVQSRV